VRRGQQAAGELVGGADVDQVVHADRLDGVVAEGADRQVLVLHGDVVRGRAADLVLAQRAPVELPLLAAAVEQLDVAVAVELEVPVGVGGEPVVVAAVEHDLVVVADALGRQQLLELGLVDEVPADLVLELGLPVDAHGAGDVAAVVGGGVFVDLDEHDTGGLEVLLGPVGRDQGGFATHGCSLPGLDGQAGMQPRGPEGRDHGLADES